jgi:hypothetical protein
MPISIISRVDILKEFIVVLVDAVEACAWLLPRVQKLWGKFCYFSVITIALTAPDQSTLAQQGPFFRFAAS